ncbi:hypothetical protein [Cryptosporidium parvum Iowa II]|uniref:Large low complexity protein with predicted coiled coil regions n=2 Tax=Cryptosporidium parvum TaxID=5807 RepID=Q5CRQ0_CRYPI|nr:hypothetical protein [Cryptosporidium parvum Iowa II]EAK88070.1 large low complexity protein with predicted coiled coil regions [Cryptosporidium parvum Iowa II]QOY41626.1 Uncharacterized protein CPATCC_0023720 [Cryptosporidium parvum]WKS77848.1 putative coiled coil-containing protein [Cryptosporidium sp. 43IA8]WRK32338.1 Uncharacterized protein cpbgf_5001940 [Cryptosporidium parvum]|eukprot:QOY41626.1 hypothetical protein CPATCC_002198 [Cryptosporidium parvum]
MSNSNISIVNGEVVLPLLELNKVKERFKDDNSAQRINELFNNDSLGSSSSNRSSVFSNNLSIPQEPELGIDKSISTNYQDISINQIKNRMLGKHCFSLVSVDWDSDEEKKVNHSNSLMNIEDYFNDKLRYNFVIPGTGKKIDLIEKGSNNPEISSIRRKNKSSKKIMDKVKSTLQSLIKSHEEEESSLTIKSSTHRSDLSYDENNQKIKLKNTIPKLSSTNIGAEDKNLERTGSKLISLKHSLVSKESKPAFSKKVTLNKSIMLKGKNIKSQEFEKETELERINPTQEVSLNSKCENASQDLTNKEVKDIKPISKTELNNSNLISINKQEMDNTQDSTTNIKVPEIKYSKNDNSEGGEKTGETRVCFESCMEENQNDVIASSNHKICNKLDEELKENYKLTIEDCSSDIKVLKDENNINTERENKADIQLLYKKEQENKLEPVDKKDIEKLKLNNQGKVEQKNDTSINEVLLNSEQICNESKDQKTQERDEIKDEKHDIENIAMDTKTAKSNKKISTMENFQAENNKTNELLEANKPTKMNNIGDNLEKEDNERENVEKESKDRRTTGYLESNPENNVDIKKNEKKYHEEVLDAAEQKISKAESDCEQDLGIKIDKDHNDKKQLEGKDQSFGLKVEDKVHSEEPKALNKNIEIEFEVNDSSKLENKSMNELNKTTHMEERPTVFPGDLKLQIENQGIRNDIDFQEELKFKVQERENLMKLKMEENQSNIDKIPTIESKDKKEVSSKALIDLKQNNKDKSETLPRYEVLETDKNFNNKTETKEVEIQKNNSIINKKIPDLNEIKPKVELIKNNDFNESSKILQKMPVHNQDNLKEMNIHDELKLLFIAKSKVNEQNKHPRTVSELKSGNNNEFKEDKIGIPVKLNPEENIISQGSPNKKKVNEDIKLDIIENRQTNTEHVEVIQKNDIDNSNRFIKKYPDQLNKQVSPLTIKVDNSLISNESKSNSMNKSIPLLKGELAINTKKDSQKKINKMKAASGADISNANIKSEISMPIDSQKCANQLSNTDLKDNGIQRKSESKDILKGKWSEIMKDKTKILSNKKRENQVKKTSNEDIANRDFKEENNLKNFSSPKNSNFQVKSSIEVDNKTLVSKASLKKIITLEDCISSEVVHNQSKQNENELIKLSDSSLSFKGDKIQKPLLSQKKRMLLRCHLTVPKLQYKIYSSAHQINSTSNLIRSETNIVKVEDKQIQFSQFRGVLNRLCEIFGSTNQENNKECKDLDYKAQRKQSAEFELKPFEERNSLARKNSGLLIKTKLDQHGNFLSKEQSSQGEVNNCGNRKLVAIEKLLSSDFSSIEQNDQSYRKFSSNILKMENKNSKKLVRRISRKKIANRNIHNVLDLNNISIRSPKNEEIVNTTNKALKINLMENVLKSEHQIHPVKTLETKKFATNKRVELESEIGTSTINMYEDIYMKNRTRRNYFKLLKNYTNIFNSENYNSGSSCSCHICSKHNAHDKIIDPITMHIISEENKLRKMKQNDARMINITEKLNSCNNYPKHYHKHYHYSGLKSSKLEKKHRKSSCKHNHMSKHKDKYKHYKKCHRSKSKKMELKNERNEANNTFSKNMKYEQNSEKANSNSNNIYCSNDFALLKDQIETILREYGVIDRVPRQDMSSNAQNCNLSIEPNDISILKDILLDTNKLLSQNIEASKTKPQKIKENLPCSNNNEQEKNIDFSELETNKYTENRKVSRLYEILRLPSNGLERAIIHRNMMRMKLDLDKIRKDEFDRIINTQTTRRCSKNGQRIAKGRRSIPNISKTNNSAENFDPNRQGSLKMVKKTILKSSKQQSDTKNQSSSWFSSWFGNNSSANEIQEDISPIEKDNTFNQETLDKKVANYDQIQIKKSAVNSNSSPKAKQANSPPPPLAQGYYVDNKSNNTKYYNSSKSDARATKATSNDDESIDLNSFIDFSDQDVSTQKNNLEIEKEIEENYNKDEGPVPEAECETNEQESSFWGWFGYSTTPENPKAKIKTAKTTQKNITKNNQQKLKRKASNKLPPKANNEGNREHENSPQTSSSAVPAQETSWFTGWFGIGAESSPPPPPPPTPTLRPKDKPKWSPPPPLEPIDNSANTQTIVENGFGQENEQPPPPPPTPAPVEESSWFSSWFGGTTEPAKVNDLKERPAMKNVGAKKKSSVKSKVNQQNIATVKPINELPSIKISPAPEPTQPTVEESSWFSGWFGASETTPAPPPTPTATINPEPTKTPTDIPKESSTPPQPQPPAEESSWFSGWFGASETTPAPPPTPTATINPEPTKTPTDIPKESSTPPQPQPPAEESSWFSGWFGASETTPAPPPTPTATANPKPRKNPKEAPKKDSTPSSPPIPQSSQIQPTSQPQPQPQPPAEESSWFSGWFGASETTPAPPPTPTATINPEPTKVPTDAKENLASSPPPPSPPPPAEESSWFSGWFGASETTPAPPPTPTITENPTQNNPSTNNLQIPNPSNPTPSPTPQTAEDSSWFGGWLGGQSEPTPPAPPPTPSGGQESSWFSGFGW